MNTRAPAFQFRLRDGLSIGPAVLKSWWSAACGGQDVKVSREPVSGRDSAAVGHRYSLYAPPARFDPATAEARMRIILRSQFPAAHVTLVRLA